MSLPETMPAKDTNDVLISISGLGKTFAKTIQSNQRRLARAVIRDLIPFRLRTPALRAHEFKVLQDITLTIRRGEAVGLVGHNGAGKTTLLKILAGHLSAEEGTVEVRGDVSDLINLTAGYQKTLSGRDNIYIGGALRGKSRREIRKRFDDIVEFSELGEFIDAPFGTYSMGMKMRLGFSVAVHTDPDVLLIDEVLGVGDLRFRNKCLGRLQEMKDHVAFVLVTHSMSQIRDFCERAIMIDKGCVIFDGDANKAADLYDKTMSDETAELDLADAAATGPSLSNVDVLSVLSAAWSYDAQAPDPKDRTPVFKSRINLLKTIETPKLGLQIYDTNGAPIVSLSDPNNPDLLAIKSGLFNLEVTMLNLRLNPGVYPTVLVVRDGAELIYREQAAVLTIPTLGGRPWGLVQTANRWTVSTDDTPA
jgi:ABC-type polysaccharide/polyol phosphate transport system ATPase subunit